MVFWYPHEQISCSEVRHLLWFNVPTTLHGHLTKVKLLFLSSRRAQPSLLVTKTKHGDLVLIGLHQLHVRLAVIPLAPSSC